jgi:hypothetical protein
MEHRKTDFSHSLGPYPTLLDVSALLEFDIFGDKDLMKIKLTPEEEAITFEFAP